MDMKSNFRQLIILLVCVFTMFSCEEVKDKVTTNVKLGDFSVELDDIEIGGVKSAIVRLAEGAELNPFSVTQVISMAMLKDLSTNIEEYQSRIEKVEIGSASIVVTTTDVNGKVVKDFLMVATGTGIKLSVANYNLGDAFSEGVEEFVTQLLMKLFTGSEISLNISGKTDVVSGKTLKVTIFLKDVVIKAKVLSE